MDNHRCKLCSRRFLTGRALGGHMKAHLSFLPPRPAATSAHRVMPPTLSSTASDDDVPAIYIPRKNISLSDLDSESENESRDRGGERKKRSRSVISGDWPESPETEPVSSVSDTFPEEDVAMCLMMLRRDDGSMNPSQKKVKENGADSAAQKKVHRCEICQKCFRSSQALGGHRIIHSKKTAVVVAKEKVVVVASNKRYGDESHRIFECPFCGKVFSSGQALGGHKRSHLMGGLGRSLSSSSSAVVGDTRVEKINDNDNCIDLNLPAPMEDEDVCSVVSDDYNGGVITPD